MAPAPSLLRVGGSWVPSLSAVGYWTVLGGGYLGPDLEKGDTEPGILRRRHSTGEAEIRLEKQRGFALKVTTFAALTLTTVILGFSSARGGLITANTVSPASPLGSSRVVLDLSGITVPSQSTINGNGYTIIFAVDANEGVVHDATVGVNANPVASSIGGIPEYLTARFSQGF